MRYCLILTICLALCGRAIGNFRYGSFENTLGFSMVGDAKRQGTGVRLASRDANRGALHYGKKLNIFQGFESRFRIRVSNPGGIARGADGFAFLIHGSGTKALGDDGQGIGYSGLRKCVAVEFDLYENSSDPDDHHISVHSKGIDPVSSDESDSLAITSDVPYLADGQIHEIIVRYRSGVLAIFLDGQKKLSVPLNLGSLVGTPFLPSAYFGLSAATASAYADFDILSWELSTDLALDTRAVLLVHGINSNSDVWSVAKAKLTALGYVVEVLDFNKESETLSNQAGVEKQAKAISRRIRGLIARSGLKTVNVVAHSMGGLSTRWYLANKHLWQDGKGLDHGVRKLIMLGTPNLGADPFIVNPVVSTIAARFADGKAGYQFNNVTQGFKDLYADWMVPSPERDYPTDFKLAKWPNTFSPISDYSYVLASLALKIKTEEDDDAIRKVRAAIPSNNRHVQHRKFAASQSLLLGTARYPLTGDKHGIDFRRMSPVIYQLSYDNPPSDVPQFAIAGNQNRVLVDHLPDLNPGPYSIPSDGIVPLNSVLGIDPITGEQRLDLRESRTLFINHTAMPKSGTVIDIVAGWLKAIE